MKMTVITAVVYALGTGLLQPEKEIRETGDQKSQDHSDIDS